MVLNSPLHYEPEGQCWTAPEESAFSPGYVGALVTNFRRKVVTANESWKATSSVSPRCRYSTLHLPNL
jgi:hypothetical protein